MIIPVRIAWDPQSRIPVGVKQDFLFWNHEDHHLITRVSEITQVMSSPNDCLVAGSCNFWQSFVDF